MNEMLPAVDVDRVCFGYDETEILHNVSFQLPAHSLTGIVGPNGGGKTTLLRLLLGIVKPRYGHIHIFGLPAKQARHLVGYVPQAFHFDTEYPVSVNDVVLCGRIDHCRFGRYSKADHEAAEAALDRVGLLSLKKRAFSDLSGGQRQRILVAQALASSPKLLLLDEPTANVDEKAAHELHALFASLAEEITVVMVSHNLNVVAAKATHVLCVNHTVDLHTTAQIAHPHHFKTIFGDDYMILEHSENCQVVSEAHTDTPHAGKEN